ncbi:hypothetical protein F4678DRAFT_420543 [Xylaria arbuscula]|nr:hypothetical protein F4678DRAFT_420543 [Xylaria arbuscula]
MTNRNQTIQFLDIYRTSIGRIADSDVSRFERFKENIGMINEALRLAKPKASGDQKKTGNPEPPKIKNRFREIIGEITKVLGLANPETLRSQKSSNSGTPKKGDDQDSKSETNSNREMLQGLLDIEEDIEDLRQIKDIGDELIMMESLFRTQEVVVGAMHQIIYPVEDWNGSKNISQGVPNYLRTSSHLSGAVVEQNLKEVKRLSLLAGKAEAAIEQLLDLKQKQADLILTNAIYNINYATDKQGKTILTFTVVTVIFLPLSFMASFLALQVAQFPWDGDKLQLNWVVKIILSVSLPLSAVLLIIAFNLNKSQRDEHFGPFTKWILTVKGSRPGKGALAAARVSTVARLSAVREQSTAKLANLRQRIHNPQQEDEEARHESPSLQTQ